MKDDNKVEKRTAGEDSQEEHTLSVCFFAKNLVGTFQDFSNYKDPMARMRKVLEETSEEYGFSFEMEDECILSGFDPDSVCDFQISVDGKPVSVDFDKIARVERKSDAWSELRGRFGVYGCCVDKGSFSGEIEFCGKFDPSKLRVCVCKTIGLAYCNPDSVAEQPLLLLWSLKYDGDEIELENEFGVGGGRYYSIVDKTRFADCPMPDEFDEDDSDEENADDNGEVELEWFDMPPVKKNK